MNRPVFAAVFLLSIATVSCEGPAGLDDPTELQVGSFRGEVTGAVTKTFRGDAHSLFGKSSRTSKHLWLLRLGAPAGTGPDSVFLSFRLERPLQNLPEEGSYPVLPYQGDLRYTPDSVWIGMDFDPGALYFARSGSLTVTEAVENEDVAGRFAFVAQAFADDSATDQTISVEGVFRAGAP